MPRRCWEQMARRDPLGGVCGRGEGSAPLCWGCRVGGAAGVGAVGREWGDQCLKAGEQWVRAVAVLYG